MSHRCFYGAVFSSVHLVIALTFSIQPATGSSEKIQSSESFSVPHTSVEEEAITSDVLVYGATPAGIMAAIALRRGGLSVSFLDQGLHVGGMVTSGLSRSDVCRQRDVKGLARDFFRRIGRHYGKSIEFRFEPHVASKIFRTMLHDNKLRVTTGTRLVAARVKKDRGQSPRIEEVTSEFGGIYRAKYFIDATYEGDLMALAGVSFAIGREGRHRYGEPLAGFTTIAGLARQNWRVAIDPYWPDGTLLPHVAPDPGGVQGRGDAKLPAYNFRIIVTDRPDNKVMFTPPPNYDEDEFELLARYLESVPNLRVDDIFTLSHIQGGKIAVNNKGPFSSNLVGGSYGWPEGNPVVRGKIWREHKRYTKALMYFLSTSARVPRRIQATVKTWGYAKDEFTKTANWPPQLYVRVGRRLRGEYVLTTHDIFVNRRKRDVVAIGSCPLEAHHVQRFASQGRVINEGYVGKRVEPYQIPYRSLLPKRAELRNLIVPVAVSASHLAYSSLRMEPVFMAMGEAAGMAVRLAIATDVPLHDVDIRRRPRAGEVGVAPSIPAY